MKHILFASLVLLLAPGCENGVLVLTEDDRAAVKLKAKERGDIRRALFVECMELAAKMPRQSDDDVSDIVQACGGQASYMAIDLARGMINE